MDPQTAMVIASLALKGVELFMQLADAVAEDLTDEQVQAIAKQTDEVTNKLLKRVAEIKQRQTAKE